MFRHTCRRVFTMTEQKVVPTSTDVFPVLMAAAGSAAIGYYLTARSLRRESEIAVCGSIGTGDGSTAPEDCIGMHSSDLSSSSRLGEMHDHDGDPDHWPQVMQDYLQGFSGKDSKGQPILYDMLDPGQIVQCLNQCSNERVRQWHIDSCESIQILQQEANVDSFCGYIDLSRIGLHSLRHAPRMLSFCEHHVIDQQFVPQHVERIFLVNPPGVLKIMWPAVELFLDEKTKRKLFFAKKPEEVLERLGITWDQVPEEFGGNLTNGLLTVKEVLSKARRPPVPQEPASLDSHQGVIRLNPGISSAMGSLGSREERTGPFDTEGMFESLIY